MELLHKKELMELIPGIKELMQKHPNNIKTPIDIATDMNGKREEIPVKELPSNHPIFDIGTRTVEDYSDTIKTAKSIVVSGPMGVFEKEQFSLGTKKILEEIAGSKAFSLAGGGHTIAAIDKFGLNNRISYISTAGGALIEFLMGKKLPGVVALEKAAARKT
jgi:phosphoglycerate kinase